MGAVVAMTQSSSGSGVKPESAGPGPPRQVSGPGVTTQGVGVFWSVAATFGGCHCVTSVTCPWSGDQCVLCQAPGMRPRRSADRGRSAGTTQLLTRKMRTNQGNYQQV